MINKQPKISVLMPVYNTKEEYLREAIESILNQTYMDFEFIIVNDGSINNAENVILSYKDKRVRYYKNDTNLGLPETRNILISLAKGEYVAIMDSDDISFPERFAKQVDYLDAHQDVSLVSANTENFPINNAVKYPENVDYFTILKGCWINNPVVMYRKADFEKYNLKYDMKYRYAEDYELWSRAIRHLKFVNLPDILLKYRCHKDSFCNNNKANQTKYAKKIRQNMIDYLVSDKELKKKLLFKISNIELIFLLKITLISKWLNKISIWR
jgi:glycosyltransferase involved in cell wall biosynthesis